MNQQDLITKNEMLLIDTSTPLLFLARAVRLQDNRWQTTHFNLQKVIREKDTWLKEAVEYFVEKYFPVPPQVIAVGEGPGSFTSIRAGFTFASVLALLWDVPTIVFSSYSLLEKIILLQREQKEFFQNNEQGTLLLRANRYMFFGREGNTVKALPKEKWRSKNIPLLFFAFENQEEIKKEFEQISFVPFSLNNITDKQNENFFVDDLFCYPLKENEDFPFVPNYGIELTFKQKKDTHEI